jgi:hypothetical protein
VQARRRRSWRRGQPAGGVGLASGGGAGWRRRRETRHERRHAGCRVATRTSGGCAPCGRCTSGTRDARRRQRRRGSCWGRADWRWRWQRGVSTGCMSSGCCCDGAVCGSRAVVGPRCGAALRNLLRRNGGRPWRRPCGNAPPASRCCSGCGREASSSTVWRRGRCARRRSAAGGGRRRQTLSAAGASRRWWRSGSARAGRRGGARGCS